jgi:hypothetical protein
VARGHEARPRTWLRGPGPALRQEKADGALLPLAEERAEAEQLRAQRHAEKLRAAGIDPEE